MAIRLLVSQVFISILNQIGPPGLITVPFPMVDSILKEPPNIGSMICSSDDYCLNSCLFLKWGVGGLQEEDFICEFA